MGGAHFEKGIDISFNRIFKGAETRLEYWVLSLEVLKVYISLICFHLLIPCLVFDTFYFYFFDF